jgi:hypothetical protein
VKGRSAQEHVDRYAERFADELQPILHIDGITENTDLLGAYTEAALRNLIRRGYQPLQVCRGGVLDYPQERLAQTDIIIWSPHPAPPIFNIEGFGLVPRSSVFGILEVKKSNYSGVDIELGKFVSDIDKMREEADAGGMPSNFPTRALGVVAALKKKPSRRLSQLMDKKKAVAIFDLRAGQRKKVRVNDVVVLINFLYTVMWGAWKAHALEKPPLLITKD